jgi:hypothetical protein
MEVACQLEQPGSSGRLMRAWHTSHWRVSVAEHTKPWRAHSIGDMAEGFANHRLGE